MSATERLYYHDSRLLEFDARVIDLSQRDDGAIAVVLDRTAFYPTGGGQPNDTGSLGEARVIDCIDAEDDGVLHVIQGPAPEVGDSVHGKVDWLRRLDHMQQHTGQHILSAAFVRLFHAPTRSFRVLEHECEIDVALDDPTDEKIEAAVDLANQIVWEARPIQVQHVNSEESASLPLRKEPAREGELRLIQIEEYFFLYSIRARRHSREINRRSRYSRVTFVGTRERIDAHSIHGRRARPFGLP